MYLFSFLFSQTKDKAFQLLLSLKYDLKKLHFYCELMYVVKFFFYTYRKCITLNGGTQLRWCHRKRQKLIIINEQQTDTTPLIAVPHPAPVEMPVLCEGVKLIHQMDALAQ